MRLAVHPILLTLYCKLSFSSFLCSLSNTTLPKTIIKQLLHLCYTILAKKFTRRHSTYALQPRPYNIALQPSLTLCMSLS
ncbi:hypothetical protein BDF22DRAFT_687571 [Syncephalis plumigaleata]|nr:hypothetical protein BDF22DRAFT_687549 [Syncephalis plumigaleata]KAI8052304.1 hypothetical protein BDF22DRAFT_687571 [Syncephalis plumigaleata]